jgi:uroporphyrinogen decarboxylase
MVRAFKGAGARRVILHSDGNIGPLLDMLLDAGIDGINPVEPRASMDLVKLKKKYDRRLAFIGGMCNARVLPGGTRREIVRKTREILEAGQSGGVVIGTHSIGDDIPVANYDLYHETARRNVP